MNQTDFFKALSDPTRLSVLKIILKNQNVCVCEFTEQMQISQPKVSRHLALLRNLSIVLDQRKGQWIYYSINPDLPSWANDVLNILAVQNDDLMTHTESDATICIDCEK